MERSCKHEFTLNREGEDGTPGWNSCSTYRISSIPGGDSVGTESDICGEAALGMESRDESQIPPPPQLHTRGQITNDVVIVFCNQTERPGSGPGPRGTVDRCGVSQAKAE